MGLTLQGRAALVTGSSRGSARGHMGQEENTVKVFAFLCTDAAGMVTGAIAMAELGGGA